MKYPGSFKNPAFTKESSVYLQITSALFFPGIALNLYLGYPKSKGYCNKQSGTPIASFKGWYSIAAICKRPPQQVPSPNDGAIKSKVVRAIRLSMCPTKAFSVYA
jgi:hypothetical protein